MGLLSARGRYAVLSLLRKVGEGKKLNEFSESVVAQILLILEAPKAFETATAYLHARNCVCHVITEGMVSQLDEPGQQALAKSFCEFMQRGSHTEM